MYLMAIRRLRPLPVMLALSLIATVLITAAIPAFAGDKVYSFTFVNGVTIEGTAGGSTVFVPNAGGTSVDNPTGMDLHVSCSDEFTEAGGGWGEKDGPVFGVDTAWQVESFTIGELKDGAVTPKCSDNFGPPPPPPAPSIDIEKTVNGVDADNPPGPTVQVGETVTLGYEVTNNGNIDVVDVVVTDLDLGVIGCPKTALAAGESMTCDSKTMDVTQPGAVFMEARVDAVGKVSAIPTPPDGGKEIGYIFNFVNGETISGISDNNTVDVSNAGGTSVDNPTGMKLHVSCSDKFTEAGGGWGEKDGPEFGVDTAWQIASFSIVKDEGDKTCGEVFQPAMIPVSDDDPINYLAEEDTPPPPVCSVVADNDAMTVKMTWDPIPGATIYAVKRNDTWLTRVNGTMFTDTNPPKGEKLTYFLRWIKPGFRSDYIPCGMVELPDGPPPPPPPPPPVCSATADVDAMTVKLTWEPVPGAVTYAVKRNGTWLTRVNGTMFTDTNPPKGQMLEYFFRWITPDFRSDYVSCGKVTIPDTPPPPPPPPPVDPPPSCRIDILNGKVTVWWGAVDGANSYQVRADGHWQVRTGELTWMDTSPGTNYTVEAVYPGEVKSTRTPCPPGS